LCQVSIPLGLGIIDEFPTPIIAARTGALAPPLARVSYPSPSFPGVRPCRNSGGDAVASCSAAPVDRRQQLRSLRAQPRPHHRQSRRGEAKRHPAAQLSDEWHRRLLLAARLSGAAGPQKAWATHPVTRALASLVTFR